MDKTERKAWNANHKTLKEMLRRPEKHEEAVQLFLTQHSLLHTISNQESLAAALLDDLTESTFRKYPVKRPDTKNSIAWHLWHVTRIEDMTMNILVAGRKQVLSTANWLEQLHIPFEHSGNDMSEADIAKLSKEIDFKALLLYRQAVGKHTQEIISQLEAGQFRLKVESDRINRLFTEKAVTEDSTWLAEYWSKKTIAGLVLMPATRHIFLHLNKCIRIKERHQKMVDLRDGKEAVKRI
ncbi:DinB family protein [Ornithinibacillus massiliensis]|uniref:DinB family protein n=1 Tax=Ornithinibacillus massiliensis TaxID=1944633 RepID=A0ABS5MEQ4_9BACI|nr:DinB family protein [Ornithinibacillus massiliensis]MBS3680816.1 DinB family protein [Ornithinibacillus massiliensis]